MIRSFFMNSMNVNLRKVTTQFDVKNQNIKYLINWLLNMILKTCLILMIIYQIVCLKDM